MHQSLLSKRIVLHSHHENWVLMLRWCDSAAAVLKGELWDYLHAACACLSTQSKVIILSAFNFVIRADFEQSHQSRGRSVLYSLTAALHSFFFLPPVLLCKWRHTLVTNTHTHWLTLLMPASWAAEDSPLFMSLNGCFSYKTKQNQKKHVGWWFTFRI